VSEKTQLYQAHRVAAVQASNDKLGYTYMVASSPYSHLGHFN